jgi:hypothetical protein
MISKSKIRELAQKALEREKAKPPKPEKPLEVAEEWSWSSPDPKPSSEDAMGHQVFRRGGFSREEKREYARQKFVEELVQPPKNPPPEWLFDRTLLPMKPPGKG